MKKIYSILVSALVAFALTACSGKAPTIAGIDDGQDIRIFTVANPDGKITTATIEKAFEETGFVIDGNNNMNSPFKPRFGKTYYQTYHLFTVHNSKHVLDLVKDYPSIGLLSPLSMSIYSNRDDDTANGKTMSISGLTLRGMSRITGIPMDNPDLIAYSKLLEKALRKALPGGEFKELNYEHIADMLIMHQTNFVAELGGENEDEILEAKDDFEAEFEGEMEPIGFLFPGFVDFASEFDDAGYTGVYDYYDTYSVCKLDVIYPIHQDHPEVGAFAPCTFYIYKKKGEAKTYMGYPAVDNWISSTDLDTEKEKTFDSLLEAEKLFQDTVKSIIE
ncbi:MAG: DUF302 domain-containing protein [Sulfurovum sp.]|uniref:DUF302 domain-containing protein n=1 Tax=Sulfurovum sp. TaxID=1969726 RepID=UPI002867F0C7|nr:DUF302 domain-containing protein [Sulfurovum sp.]MCO4846323.1 DUF302 domain-containing protein [Sulfurovum sp.]